MTGKPTQNVIGSSRDECQPNFNNERRSVCGSVAAVLHHNRAARFPLPLCKLAWFLARQAVAGALCFRFDRRTRSFLPSPSPRSVAPHSRPSLSPSLLLLHPHTFPPPLTHAPQDAASSRVEVRVSDAVPLFHTHTLAPMLELAALLTQTRCEENGLEIVGCYFASERLEKPGVSPPVSDTVKSVAKTIVENLKSSGKARGLGAGGALVLGVDGAKLGKYIFLFSLV